MLPLLPLGLDSVEDLLDEVLDSLGLASDIGLRTTGVLAISGDARGLPDDHVPAGIHHLDGESDLDLPLQDLRPLPSLAGAVVPGGVVVASDTSADNRICVL
jgi:hypothetical protein